MTVVGTDKFGIVKLFPTAAYGLNNFRRGGNGWEYYADKWNQRKLYEFKPDGSVMPEHNDLFMHYKNVPNSFIIVNGDGSITLTSDEKHNPMILSIYDDNNLYYGIQNALTTGRRWSPNNEFTLYFSIGAYPLSYKKKGAISITLGSDHHFLDNIDKDNIIGGNTYNAHEYTLVMQYDGHMYLTGEPYHGCFREQKPDGIYNVDFWDTNFTGIPLNRLYGIKFIKRVIDKNDIFLEVYRDLTGGYNGGEWRPLFEFRHSQGNWYNTDMDAPYASALANPQYSVVRPLPIHVDQPHVEGGGGQCYIKIDPIHEIKLKYVSCRDIEPELFAPVTTTAELENYSEQFGQLYAYKTTEALFDVEVYNFVEKYNVADNAYYYSLSNQGGYYSGIATRITTTNHPLYDIIPHRVIVPLNSLGNSTGNINCVIWNSSGSGVRQLIETRPVSDLGASGKKTLTFENFSLNTGDELALNEYIGFYVDSMPSTFLRAYHNNTDVLANTQWYGYYFGTWYTYSTSDWAAKVYEISNP
jgi:hypothetical protein